MSTSNKPERTVAVEICRIQAAAAAAPLAVQSRGRDLQAACSGETRSIQHDRCKSNSRRRGTAIRCHDVTVGGIAGDRFASAAPSARDDLALLRRRTGFVSLSGDAVADADWVASASPLPHPPLEFIVDSISASEGAVLAFLMESLSPRTVDGRIRRAVGMSPRARERRRGEDRGREVLDDVSMTDHGVAMGGARRGQPS